MTSARTSRSLALAFVLAATGAHAQDGSIQIFSPNADPSNPITIQSPAAPAQAAPAPAPQAVPRSSLDQIPAMSERDAQAMMRIYEMIEQSNAVEEITQDDPLAGLSPDQRAYIEAMQAVMPMTPEQIRMFKQRFEESRSAQRAPVGPDAAPSSRSVDLTLKPGEQLPVIRMQAGSVTTLTFSDRNGAPWPIQSVTTGDGSRFAAQTAGAQGTSNILVLNTMTDYAMSNAVVTLVGNPVPVLMTLDAREQTKVDYRVDIRIDDKGPNSEFAIADSYRLPATGDKLMLAFLDGLPPRGAIERQTSAGGVEAWVYEDQLYVRTRGEILSPAYTARSSNVSGTKVFVLHESPVLVLSQNGVVDTVSVSPN
jgi:intracellular multiplication protein IcmK